MGSADSATFNPPNMIGVVTERTAMEAMIMHSDNTGTDMMLKFTGPGNVRSFIASAGLTKTMIPDSTRVFFAYLLGLPDYQTATFLDVVAASSQPFAHPPLNPVQTLASSADDFVSYYSGALLGKFFQHQETLNQFLEILSIGDAIWLIPVPLGVSALAKGGSIDVPGFHAVSAPGGLFFNNRWVFFCFTLNWPAPGDTDPETVAAWTAAVHQALQIVITALS